MTVLAGAGEAPLDGGIRLKDRQKLLGERQDGPARPAARLTSRSGPGDAITLASGNEIADRHVDNPAGAAIFGDNVSGTTIRDVLLTRRGTAPPGGLDAALCRIVRSGGAVDNAGSTLRGCGARQAPLVEAAVVLLADDRSRTPLLTHTLERVTIEDHDAAATAEVLWPAGISVTAAGSVEITVNVRDTSMRILTRGIAVRAYDRASADAGACRKLGFTSAGQNRIVGNPGRSKSYSPYVEAALQEPGSMMAQGNYWGDITPADARGDAPGDCSVHEWSGDPNDESPPVPEGRCDLYTIPGHGSPTGSDGRFHLTSDPRPDR